jgi:PD-(D/E)XK nuclease superfamily protein
MVGPLIDEQGREVWDSTKLSAYADCEYLGKLQYEEHLKSKEPAVALVFGGAFHKAVEEWTQARSQKLARGGYIEHFPDDIEAVKIAEAAFITEWEAGLTLETREMLEFSGDRRSVANFKRLFAGYRKKFPLEMYQEVVACEVPFTLPLGTTPAGREVHWSGLIDRVVKWMDGVYYVDLKTSSYTLDAAFFNKFKLSGQIRGYVWAAEQLHPREQFAGAMIHGVQVQAPLKTKVRLPEELVQGEVIPLSPPQIEQWRENTLKRIDVIHEARARGHLRNYASRCSAFGGGCEMKQVCWAEPDAEDTIKGLHYVERVWDPRNRTVVE